MEKKDVALSIFLEIRERGDGEMMEFQVTAHHASVVNWL